MAHQKRMIKFTKEQFDILQAGKIILNRHALLPKGITPLNDEQFIMDCIMFQSQELIKQLEKASKNESSSSSNKIERDTPDVRREENNIPSEGGSHTPAVSGGTPEESK